MEFIASPVEAPRPVTASLESSPVGPDAAKEPEISPPVSDKAEETKGENKENETKMRKMTGYMHYSNSSRSGVKAEIDADEANAALTSQEKNQKVMQILGARWKGLDDGAKATWAAAAPEYEVKPPKPKKAKKSTITEEERSRARAILERVVAEKLKKRGHDSLDGAFDGPVAPVATKKLSGKQHYEKEYRAAVKAAVERDHADIGGKEKQALVAKALGEGWKALDDGAKAKWAADAPTVEVKAKKAKVAEPAPEPVEMVLKKLSGKQHYDKETRAEAKSAVERDHADASGKEKQALVQKALGEGWKALDDDAKAKWAADAPEVEVKKKAPKAPEPEPMVVTKQLSGKEFYVKEKRAETKAAVERDHADVGGKEKQALILKALGDGWKALDDDAKAKWAADAPEVEVKKKAPKAPEPEPVETVTKQLSGKEFYVKEKRAETKAAVERDHADVGGKEKQALILKALGAGPRHGFAFARWTPEKMSLFVAKAGRRRRRRQGQVGGRTREVEVKKKKAKAPEPAPAEVVVKQLSGKEFYNKEKRRPRPRRRDHADVSGKEKLALVSKALADGWKALDERAQAKWTVDAPRVEVQKRPGAAAKGKASRRRPRRSGSRCRRRRRPSRRPSRAPRPCASRTGRPGTSRSPSWRTSTGASRAATTAAEPAAPPHRLPPVEDGFTRVFVERAVFTPVGVAPFALDRNGDVPGTRGYLMPKIARRRRRRQRDLRRVHRRGPDMYYDVPTDPAEAEDYEVDLTIAFACMYTHAMLVEEFARSARLRPRFDKRARPSTRRASSRRATTSPT
ncbi:hypothetical protein SO694_00046292 [Aureococcus anophagefferens]|uniref:HMG box domain-containing protein n=1 Tax=Aureococcus anophagefferens TaxID=44056 RepID=A0ABR1G8E4_AURAN